MYNRYIPQPDGSYRRSRESEPQTPRRRPEVSSPTTQDLPDHSETECKAQPQSPGKGSNRDPIGIGRFFRQLLPRDMDTGDLLVILLLLLIAGDNEADRNNALLTMALYFFM